MKNTYIEIIDAILNVACFRPFTCCVCFVAGLYPVVLLLKTVPNILCILIINTESKPTDIGVTKASKKKRRDFSMFFAVKVSITKENSHHNFAYHLARAWAILKNGALLCFHTVLHMYKNTPPVFIYVTARFTT